MAAEVVAAAVLFAALLHASWNALLKGGEDRFFTLLVMQLTMSAIAGVGLLFLPLPPRALWPWLLAGMALHHGYRLALLHGYARADLGEIYPIARGFAPALVTVVAFFVAGDRLAPRALAGVALISAGMFLLSRQPGRPMPLRTVLAGITISLFIAGYTVTDGIGARASGYPVSYALLLFTAGGPLTLATWILWRGFPLPVTRTSEVLKGVASGAVSLLAYAVVIWALTLGPMGAVSALRETSIMFAVLIGAAFMGEPMSSRRLLAAAIIVGGAVALGQV